MSRRSQWLGFGVSSALAITLAAQFGLPLAGDGLRSTPPAFAQQHDSSGAGRSGSGAVATIAQQGGAGATPSPTTTPTLGGATGAPRTAAQQSGDQGGAGATAAATSTPVLGGATAGATGNQQAAAQQASGQSGQQASGQSGQQGGDQAGQQGGQQGSQQGGQQSGQQGGQGGQQAGGQGGQQAGGGGQPAAVAERPFDRFSGRLDAIQGYFDRGDCGGAESELRAIFQEGPDELIRAGLSYDEINTLQSRLDGFLVSLSRC